MIRLLLKIYMYALIFDAIFSYFPELEKYQWRKVLRKGCNYTCDPIRKRLPAHLPFDFSPLLVILLINLLIFLW
ncbi:MAG: YggT family protein [Bacteriovorax sp.]